MGKNIRNPIRFPMRKKSYARQWLSSSRKFRSMSGVTVLQNERITVYQYMTGDFHDIRLTKLSSLKAYMHGTLYSLNRLY